MLFASKSSSADHQYVTLRIGSSISANTTDMLIVISRQAQQVAELDALCAPIKFVDLSVDLSQIWLESFSLLRLLTDQRREAI